MKKIFYSKNLLFLVFINLFLIQDCSLLLLIPKNCTEKIHNIEIGKPFKGTPSNIVIDENNNGIISFREEIIKINNLEIGEKICLKEAQGRDCVGNTAYSTDKDGDGILIYSIQNDPCLSIYPDLGSIDDYRLIFSNYIVKIEKNNFLVDKVKKLYEIDTYYKGFKILQFDKNNFLVYFLSQGYGNDKWKVVLKRINNLDLNNYNINEYKFDLEDDGNNFYNPYEYLDLDLNLDSNGNGWYAFKIFRNNLFQKIENYKNTSQIKDLSKDSDTFYNFLDTNGNGYILNFKDFILSKSNVNNLISDNLNIEIFKQEQNLINYFPFSVDSKWLNINKNGEGVILLGKNISNTNDEKIALVIKKIKDFKEISQSVISSNDSNYSYYASSINSNGNGIVILRDSSNRGFFGKNFILKRIRNYELEK
ncbi:MAG: hypothetical protein AABZ74_11250 [Cyanobacteriota bacterium]